MNWKELKDFANSLNEHQLSQKVILWREDESIQDIEAMNLEEDHYIGNNDEGCYPESDASEPIDNLRKVYDKGHPILWEKF